MQASNVAKTDERDGGASLKCVPCAVLPRACSPRGFTVRVAQTKKKKESHTVQILAVLRIGCPPCIPPSLTPPTPPLLLPSLCENILQHTKYYKNISHNCFLKFYYKYSTNISQVRHQTSVSSSCACVRACMCDKVPKCIINGRENF